jgi:hypothetical protein
MGALTAKQRIRMAVLQEKATAQFIQTLIFQAEQEVKTLSSQVEFFREIVNMEVTPHFLSE